MRRERKVKYTCDKFSITWTVGTSLFEIQGNKDDVYDMIDADDMSGERLMDISRVLDCEYNDMLIIICSMVITYAQNYLKKPALTQLFDISRGTVILREAKEAKFTDNKYENIKVLHTLFNSGDISIECLKHIVPDLSYIIGIDYYNFECEFELDIKCVVHIKGNDYIVNKIYAYQQDDGGVNDEDFDRDFDEGYDTDNETDTSFTGVVRVQIEDTNGKSAELYIEASRFFGMIQGYDTNIVKKLRVMGYELVDSESVQNEFVKAVEDITWG